MHEEEREYTERTYTGKVITLTWPQAIWGVTIVFILGGSWIRLEGMGKDIADLKLAINVANRDVYSRNDIDIKERIAAQEHARLWEHVQELEKSYYGRVKPK